MESYDLEICVFFTRSKYLWDQFFTQNGPFVCVTESKSLLLDCEIKIKTVIIMTVGLEKNAIKYKRRV